MIVFALAAAALFLAYANGANDNFNGVATLFGSGTAGYRRALVRATVTTLAVLPVGQELTQSFSGKGLVAEVVTADPRFLVAVGFGAAGTVILATDCCGAQRSAVLLPVPGASTSLGSPADATDDTRAVWPDFCRRFFSL